MVPPHVSTIFPREGGTFSGNVIVLEGSMVGMLLEETPPEVWDVTAQCAVPIQWTETTVREWYAEEPEVGGDIETRVQIVLETAVVGRTYRLRYPTDLRDVREVLLTATPSHDG